MYSVYPFKFSNSLAFKKLISQQMDFREILVNFINFFFRTFQLSQGSDCAVVWTIRRLNPGRAKDVSLLQNVQTSSGAHPASY
jgi:hypothetical protein